MFRKHVTIVLSVANLVLGVINLASDNYILAVTSFLLSFLLFHQWRGM